jgi:hypothetical protein
MFAAYTVESVAPVFVEGLMRRYCAEPVAVAGVWKSIVTPKAFVAEETVETSTAEAKEVVPEYAPVVAAYAPRVGVTSTGLVASTATVPEPVVDSPAPSAVPLVFDHVGIYPTVELPGPDTFPPPEGVAHVPSPRRKVEEDGVPVTGFAAGCVTLESR